MLGLRGVQIEKLAFILLSWLSQSSLLWCYLEQSTTVCPVVLYERFMPKQPLKASSTKVLQYFN